jgi:hypothetical protein
MIDKKLRNSAIQKGYPENLNEVNLSCLQLDLNPKMPSQPHNLRIPIWYQIVLSDRAISPSTRLKPGNEMTRSHRTQQVVDHAIVLDAINPLPAIAA